MAGTRRRLPKTISMTSPRTAAAAVMALALLATATTTTTAAAIIRTPVNTNNNQRSRIMAVGGADAHRQEESIFDPALAHAPPLGGQVRQAAEQHMCSYCCNIGKKADKLPDIKKIRDIVNGMYGGSREDHHHGGVHHIGKGGKGSKGSSKSPKSSKSPTTKSSKSFTAGTEKRRALKATAKRGVRELGHCVECHVGTEYPICRVGRGSAEYEDEKKSSPDICTAFIKEFAVESRVEDIPLCKGHQDMDDTYGHHSNDPDQDYNDQQLGSGTTEEMGTVEPDDFPAGGAGMEFSREDVMVDITDETTGACGVKPEAAAPTQVAFYVAVKYNVSLIDSDEVAVYLKKEMGPTAICTELEGPHNTETTDGSVRRQRQRSLGHTDVIGYKPCGDNFAQYGDPCASNQTDISCNLFKGQICIFCESGMSNVECYSAGLGLIQANAADAADPPNITEVMFVGGFMNSDVTGGGMDVAGPGGAEASSSIVQTRGEGGNGDGNGLGIALGVGLGVCALLVALLAVRKNRKSNTKDISFLDDEDLYSDYGDDKVHLDPGDSLDGTEIMSENGTPTSSKWRKSRPGHIVGEDDSVLSGNGVVRDLALAEEFHGANAHDLARGGSGVDVHVCNSAMCEICLARGKDPKFIPTSLEDMEIDTANGSLNTSGLSNASRSYPMEDTVDF